MTHQALYKCVYLQTCYVNRVNIHGYYVFNILLFFLSPPRQTLFPFLSSPNSLLSPSPFHSLTHSSSKQDKVVQPPTTIQPPHPNQKSHLYQTPKPKSNYTHISKQQKPNKITKSPNPRENPKLKAFCLWLLIG